MFRLPFESCILGHRRTDGVESTLIMQWSRRRKGEEQGVARQAGRQAGRQAALPANPVTMATLGAVMKSADLNDG
jgi:hypothetical protein